MKLLYNGLKSCTTGIQTCRSSHMYAQRTCWLGKRGIMGMKTRVPPSWIFGLNTFGIKSQILDNHTLNNLNNGLNETKKNKSTRIMLTNCPSLRLKSEISCYCRSKMPAKICKISLQRIQYTKYFVLTVDIMHVIMSQTIWKFSLAQYFSQCCEKMKVFNTKTTLSNSFWISVFAFKLF